MNTRFNDTPPVVLLLADNALSSDLNAIFDQQDLSSLIIAGNTIIEHLMMELQDLKVRECIILASQNANRIQSLIGDIRRWGINITVMNYSLNKEQVLREYKSLSSPNGLLVIEIDRLRSRCIGDLLAQAEKSDYALLEARHQGQPLGITLLKDNESDFIINPMPIELDVVVNKLQTIKHFHKANFDVVTNVFPGLSPSVQVNNTLGQRQHWASRVHTQLELNNKAIMIERRCRVGKGASLQSVILNHDVYVEQNARIKNTVVMPNATISAFRPIKNAIVNGDFVYQV